MQSLLYTFKKKKLSKNSENYFKNLVNIQKFFKGELFDKNTFIPKNFYLDFTSFDITDETIQNLSQFIIETPNLTHLSLRLSNTLKTKSILDKLLRKISLKQQFVLLQFYIKYLSSELLDIFVKFLSKINFKTKALTLQIKYHDKKYEREVIKRMIESLLQNNESQISEIEFLNCRFDEEETMNLLRNYLSNNKTIKVFYLNGRMIKGNKFDIDISNFQRVNLANCHLMTLTSIPISILNLEFNAISAKGIKIISDLISKESCTLKKIDLSHNFLGDEGSKILSMGIIKNNSIEKINLTGNKIVDKGIISIAKSLLINNSIKKISFKNNYITNEGIIEFCNILKDSPYDKFTSLDISLNLINHEGLVEYSRFLNIHYTNKNLSISGKISLEEQREFFINCENLNNIKIIDFYPFDIYSENYYYLNKILLNNYNIKSIFITNNNSLSGIGIQEISSGISQNKKIKQISMSQCNINDDDIEILSNALFNNIYIQDLIFDQNKIKTKGIQILSEKILPKASLRKVYLGHNLIDPNGAFHLGKNLPEVIGLQRLMLNSNKILDEGAKYISEGLSHNSSLNELNIENNNISNIGLKYLSGALKGNKNFLKLNFCSNKCTEIDDNTYSLFDWCNEIKFFGNKMSKESIIKMINGGKNNKLMKNIRFSIDDQTLVFNFKSKNSNLKVLDLAHNVINTSLISCLISLPNLSQLILTDNQIKDEETIILFDSLLEINSKIKLIKIQSNRIGEIGAEKISEFLVKNNTLKHLNLASNKIGYKGMNYICNSLINNNTMLEYLMVNYCELSDYCAEKINEMLRKNKTLLYFSFNGNYLTNKGIDIVISALRINQGLKQLCCGENKNDENAFKNLKEYLRFNKSLAILEIKNIGLNDEIAEDIGKAIINNKSLISINLVYNKITIDGMRKIAIYIGKNNNVIEVKMLLNSILGNDRNIIISECPHIIFN